MPPDRDHTAPEDPADEWSALSHWLREQEVGELAAFARAARSSGQTFFSHVHDHD